MKQIIKTKEPRSLTNYRASISKNDLQNLEKFDDLSTQAKDDLRNNLLNEQGYVCCYCMRRVEFDNSKIEHFKPRSFLRGQQLEYSNLFIACLGGEGGKKGEQHCDTKKGNDELKHIDLLTTIENDIEYYKDGFIFSTNININDELNRVLNLNYKILQDNRKEALEQLMIDLKKLGFSIPNLRRTIEKYQNRNSKGKYRPYSQLMVYFLTKKLKSKGV